jgi:hypothetical protein
VSELFLFVDRTVQRLPHDTIFVGKSEARHQVRAGICDDMRTHFRRQFSRPKALFMAGLLSVSFFPY